MHRVFLLTLSLAIALRAESAPEAADAQTSSSRPNVLFVISDDQSWRHAGAYGCPAARTPAFDRVAKQGVLFNQAFAPTPGCGPTRASILTGRNNWQNEQAGTHWSTIPPHLEMLPDRLEAAGYFIGMVGKGLVPGVAPEREHNAAGPAFTVQGGGYSDGFRKFLDERPGEKPFFFWFGAREPHPGVIRANLGCGVRAGYDLDTIEVPAFLPDTPVVRSHLADYLRLIEVYDEHLGRMLDMLSEAGELDNTIIMVTSDHGMGGFLRAKANLYEYSVRVPLAIQWGAKVPGDRKIDDLVNLIDLTATIYEATGVEPPQTYPIAGRSLHDMLRASGEGIVDASRDAVFVGRERHTSARHDNLGYPMRAIRTHDFLLIRNFAPDRWPSGAPQTLNQNKQLTPITHPDNAFADIDGSPSKDFMLAHRDDPQYRDFFLRAVGKRPEFELFDIRNDPACLRNLASDPAFAEIRDKLAARLEAHLRETGDPRIVGPDPNIFESYRRYGNIRNYPAPDEEPAEWADFIVPSHPHE